MAKVGEGDDRWIVEDRKDGANVRGWHWVEKDAMEWSRTRLTELLAMDLTDETTLVVVKITGVSALTGEAYVNKRKGKIIPGYELNIKVAYEGRVNADGGAADVTGNLHVPYLADENADEDPEVKVLPAGESAADKKVRDLIISAALPKVLQGIRTFVKEMALGGPGGDAPATGAGASDDAPHTKASSSTPSAASHHNATGQGQNGESRREDKFAPLSKTSHTIRLSENFFCRPQDICDCLLDANRVRHFTQSPADIRPGLGPFSMFDGNIHGETIEYVPAERIVQKWRFRNWAASHFSLVTITFRHPEPGNCFVDLVQTNVPETDAFGNESVMDTTENGWKNQIFSRIRTVFGYGA